MLDAILANLDGVAEALKGEYKEVDGKFMLDVKPIDGFSLDNTVNLKSALQTERTTAADAQKALKVFDGIDPKAAREALDKIKVMDDWDPDEKLADHKKTFEAQIVSKYEGEKNAAVEKLQGENKTLADRSTVMHDQLSVALIDSAATKALEQLGGSVELLLPHVKAGTRMTALDDGTYRVDVMGPDGNARLSSKAGSMEPMSVAELVEEMRAKDVFASAFKGSGASGSGASGGKVGSGAPGTHTIQQSEAKDPAKYRVAKAAAEKAGVSLQIVA